MLLNLTSYARMLRYLSTQDGTASTANLTDATATKQQLMSWITAASKQIETYLDRELHIESRTEYFDSRTLRDIELFTKAYPISTITSVFVDGSSLWDGSESEIDDVYINRHGHSIVLPSSPSVLGLKVLRAIYTGGLAYNGTRSVFAITGLSGTWTNGYFVSGGTSDALGIVRASASGSVTIENLYGIFEAAETLTEYSDEDLGTASGTSATISSITQQSLAESYPDISRACEIQVRHYWKHKDDFELNSTSRDGTNLRQRTYDQKSVLTPEAMSILEPYRRRYI